MGDRASGTEQNAGLPGRTPIRSFRDLEVWQLARELVREVYRITEAFPQREWYGLASQMRRTAVSTVSNIAEGISRPTSSDYAHFLATARSSGAELETQIVIAEDLRFLSSADAEALALLLSRIQPMLWRLEERVRAFGHNQP